MKIAILGDTHFGARNDSLHFHNAFERFYSKVFFPYLKENGITDLIQLGDIFDRRKYVNFVTLDHCRRYFFDPLVENSISACVLVGNHDTYYKNTNAVNSPSLLLNEYGNITVIEKPAELYYDNHEVLLVPWISPENEKEVIDAIRTSASSLICGHFEIEGFEMHRGMVCEHGMSTSLFANKELVISGHFHHKSKVGNIQYLGTPYQMTWSDHGDIKGFHIYDTATRELEFIKNPFDMFHKINYDDQDMDPSSVAKQDFSLYSGSFVKVIVTQKQNPYCFDLFVDGLEKAGVANIQVVEDHFHLDDVNDDDIVSEAEDTLTILRKQVASLDLGTNGISHKDLEKVMVNLYNDALNLE